MNTHMRYSNRQFCDSGNTLGRLIAPSLSQRPMLLTQCVRNVCLLIRTQYRKHLIRDVSLGAYNFPLTVYEDSSKSRYLRVTKSKLIIEYLSLEKLPRRKPMTYRSKIRNFSGVNTKKRYRMRTGSLRAQNFALALGCRKSNDGLYTMNKHSRLNASVFVNCF